MASVASAAGVGNRRCFARSDAARRIESPRFARYSGGFIASLHAEQPVRRCLYALTKWLVIEPNTARALDWLGWVDEHLDRYKEPGRVTFGARTRTGPDRDPPSPRSPLAHGQKNGRSTPAPGNSSEEQTERFRSADSAGAMLVSGGQDRPGPLLIRRGSRRGPRSVGGILTRPKSNWPRTTWQSPNRDCNGSSKSIRFITKRSSFFRRFSACRASRPKPLRGSNAETIKTDEQRLKMLLRQVSDKQVVGPQVPLEIGELFLRLEQRPLALHWLQEALARSPKHKATLDALAFLRSGER